MRRYTVIGVDNSVTPACPRIMYFEAEHSDHAYEQYVDALAAEGSSDVTVAAIYRGHLEEDVSDEVAALQDAEEETAARREVAGYWPLNVDTAEAE